VSQHRAHLGEDGGPPFVIFGLRFGDALGGALVLALIILLAFVAVRDFRPDSPTVNQIRIASTTFVDGSRRITVGTTITWANMDLVAHTVTADNGSFNSGVLDPGTAFRFTFKSTGTYRYRCRIHPFMHGTISVVAAY
jgi:hypothetical protein